MSYAVSVNPSFDVYLSMMSSFVDVIMIVVDVINVHPTSPFLEPSVAISQEVLLNVGRLTVTDILRYHTNERENAKTNENSEKNEKRSGCNLSIVFLGHFTVAIKRWSFKVFPTTYVSFFTSVFLPICFGQGKRFTEQGELQPDFSWPKLPNEHPARGWGFYLIL